MMFSGKDKNNKNESSKKHNTKNSQNNSQEKCKNSSKKDNKNRDKNKDNKDIYADYSTRSVGHSPVDLAPLLRKMEKRKKASRVLGLVSSLTIIIGLATSGYYIYKMFQPIESASISFDDIQDATPEEKQKSIDNRNKPLAYENSSDDGESNNEDTKDKEKNKSNDKKGKNIQNGSVPSYIEKLPEKASYLFNSSIFSSNDDNDATQKADEEEIDNNLEEEKNNASYNSNEDEENREENHNKKQKKSSRDRNSSTKNKSDSNDTSDKSNSDLGKKSESKNDVVSKKVTLTIVGYDGNSILDTKSIKFNGTQTVASILFSACNKYGISYKYKGSGSTVYISSLGGQAEKEHGSGSGWMVRVNGYLIDRSAGAWKVKDDDDIEWFYYSGSLEDIPRE